MLADHPNTVGQQGPDWVKRWMTSDVIRGLLAPLVFAMLLFIIVDGALPQIEMILTGGGIPLPTSLLKLGIICAVATAFLLRPKLDLRTIPTTAWLFFICYLLLDIPHLLHQNLSLGKILSEYYGYYSLVLLLPLAGFLVNTLSETVVVRVLIVAFILSAVVGIAQHFLNSALLYTRSSDGRFAIISWRFFDTNEVRSFSFFVYSVSFGLYCSTIGALGLYQALSSKSKISGIAIYVLAVICCYFTLTRVVYLVLLCSTLAVLAIHYGKTPKAIRLTSIMCFLFGGGLAYGGLLGLAGIGSHGKGLENNLSLLQRLTQMVYYWSIFSSGTLDQKLLGLGIVQDSNVNGKATFPIDNLYMALLLHIGVIGLILFLLLFWRIWKQLTSVTTSQPSPLRVAICSLWCSFLAISLFDISTAIYIAGIMLIILSTPHSYSFLRRRPQAGAASS